MPNLEEKTQELIDEAVKTFLGGHSKKELALLPDDAIRVFSFDIGDKVIDTIISMVKAKQVEAHATVELGPDDSWWNFQNRETRRE